MRYPLDALVAAAHLQPAHRDGYYVSVDTQLAERLGTRTTQHVARARRDGLSERAADNWACKLGLHPAIVWPEWQRAEVEELDRRLAQEWREAVVLYFEALKAGDAKVEGDARQWLISLDRATDEVAA